MNSIEWLRFLPFVSVSLVLLGWALIEQFSERPWNIAKVTILLVGYTVTWYLASLAVNFSWWEVTWPVPYYDAIRIVMGLSIFGVPWVWRNVWWSYQGWRERRRSQ